MFGAGFIRTFIEIFNALAAFILIFLIGRIVLMSRSVDKPLLKARLYLADQIMQETWIYISIAGAAFSLHELINIALRFTAYGNLANDYYLAELTQMIFLISFILAIYNWNKFIANSVIKK